MTDQANRPTLPMEVIYEIIDLFVPKEPDTILAPSDPRTKTFVSFTKVCRATCALASVYLWKHCVYIDSDVRLQQFLQGLQATSVSSGAGEGRRNVPSMYLALAESLGPHLLSTQWLQLGQQIREVFRELGGTLKRLVLDVPVGWLYGRAFEDALDQGLRMLTGLEEFVAVNEGIFARYTEDGIQSVCAAWPQLRRLAVFNFSQPDTFLPHLGFTTKIVSLLLITNDCAIHGAHYFDQQRLRPTSAQQQSGTVADPETQKRFVTYSIGTVVDPGAPVWEELTRLCQRWLPDPAIQGIVSGRVPLSGTESEICCGSGELFMYKGWVTVPVRTQNLGT